MIRRAILSVATGQWYPAGQQRCFDSLEERGEPATRLFWRDQYPPGSPTHEEAPYAFKPYAFKRAHELGFHVAVWLDASCWAIRSLTTLWGRLEAAGYYLEPDGHWTGEWISDRALDLLGYDRDEALRVPLIEGKCIGLDFRDETAREFLHDWLDAADRGGFQGRWTNDTGSESGDVRCRGHRHDIACGSLIADSLGMGLHEYKMVGFPGNGDPGDEVLILAQGL